MQARKHSVADASNAGPLLGTLIDWDLPSRPRHTRQRPGGDLGTVLCNVAPERCAYNFGGPQYDLFAIVGVPKRSQLRMRMLSLFLNVDGATASGGAARTGYLLHILIEMVIDRQLLARENDTHTHVEDMFLIHPGADVRFAAVINKLRAAAAGRSVQRPIFIERENIVQRTLRPNLGFLAADPFARILNHLAIGGDALTCEHTPPVNSGRFNDQQETSVPLVYRWRTFSHWWTVTLEFVIRGALLLALAPHHDDCNDGDQKDESNYLNSIH